jgi:hypothetical protein
METINRAHATIVCTIKGFEALKGGNYVVYEVITQFAPVLNAHIRIGVDQTSQINTIVRGLPRQTRDTAILELSAEQINIVATAVEDRQIAVSNDVHLSAGSVRLEQRLAVFDESLKRLFAS